MPLEDSRLIFDDGTAYNSRCNIYVYHIAVVDPVPAFLRVGKISVTGSVWCCASGGQLLVYGLESGAGDMILHICPLGPQYADVEGPALSMNIGPWSVSLHPHPNHLHGLILIDNPATAGGRGLHHLGPL